MTITKKFNDTLTRQANEAIKRKSRPDRELLNGKSELNHHPIKKKINISVAKSKLILIMIFLVSI